MGLHRAMQHSRPTSDSPAVSSPSTAAGSSQGAVDGGMSQESDDLFPRPQARASLGTRIASGVLGTLLVAVGIVLSVLPVVPGFPLIALGVLLLVAAGEPTRRFVNRGERRLPRVVRSGLRRLLRRKPAGGPR